MKQIVQCKNCDNKFLITVSNVVSDRQFEDKNGKSIYITYFDCPKCQERHYAQVDDQESLKYKKKCLDLFQILAKFKIANKSIPKQQRSKFDKFRKKLSDMRFELMKQYDDSYVTDTETGAEVHIKFTVM